MPDTLSTSYVPAADLIRTLDDGRTLQMALAGVPIPNSVALQNLSDTTNLAIYSVKVSGGGVVTATLTLDEYFPPTPTAAQEAAATTTTDTDIDADSVVLLEAAADVRHVIYQVDVLYDWLSPGVGSITIDDGADNEIFSQAITDVEPHTIVFDPPLAGSTNTNLITTLINGGEVVTGTLSVRHGQVAG